LGDGSVLLTGGCSEPGCGGFDASRSSDLFDPVANSFHSGPRMQTARASGTATLLTDGRVLLVGGYPGEGLEPTAEAEIYDPPSQEFAPVGALSVGRADHSATLLTDGRVLLAGGVDGAGAVLSTTEIFDPASSEFSSGPGLSRPRSAHVAVSVGARIVLVGGTQDGAHGLASTDVLLGSRWSPGPDLLVGRVKMGAAPIGDSRLLVVGGSDDVEGNTKFSSTEVIDLARGSTRPGPDLVTAQYKLDGAVVRLADGRVVIAGGDSVEVYDPATNEILQVPEPQLGPMSFRTATPLGPTDVLIAGGYDSGIVPSRSAVIVTVP
jgi:hypothetical protein